MNLARSGLGSRERCDAVGTDGDGDALHLDGGAIGICHVHDDVGSLAALHGYRVFVVGEQLRRVLCDGQILRPSGLPAEHLTVVAFCALQGKRYRRPLLERLAQIDGQHVCELNTLRGCLYARPGGIADRIAQTVDTHL